MEEERRAEKARGCPILAAFFAARACPKPAEGVGILTFVVLGLVAIPNSSSDPSPAPPSQTPAPSPDLSSPAAPPLRKPHPLPMAGGRRSPHPHSRWRQVRPQSITGIDFRLSPQTSPATLVPIKALSCTARRATRSRVQQDCQKCLPETQRRGRYHRPTYPRRIAIG